MCSTRKWASRSCKGQPFPVNGMQFATKTSKSEAKAEDLIHWTNGRALLATGSPFAPVNYDGRKILASIEKQPHSTEALPTKCVTVSVSVFLVPSLKRSLAGISTMKRFGNSGASDPQISAHGPWHRRQSYLSLHCRRLPNESRRKLWGTVNSCAESSL
jgi:hypothetical protein